MVLARSNCNARPANNKPIAAENLLPVHKATFTDCNTHWDASCVAALRAHVARTNVTRVPTTRNPIPYLQDLKDLEDNEKKLKMKSTSTLGQDSSGLQTIMDRY